MKWNATPRRWRRRLAILPKRISKTWIWLEWYWALPNGDHTLVSLSPGGEP
jgi:hypothetical protein